MKNHLKLIISVIVVIVLIVLIAPAIVKKSQGGAGDADKDALIMSYVQQLRAQIEADYRDNYNVSFKGGCAVGTDTACPLIEVGKYATLASDIKKSGGELTVVSTRAVGPIVAAYALYGRLASDPTKYFCIDTSGIAKPDVTTNTSITCPNN